MKVEDAMRCHRCGALIRGGRMHAAWLHGCMAYLDRLDLCQPQLLVYAPRILLDHHAPLQNTCPKQMEGGPCSHGEW